MKFSELDEAARLSRLEPPSGKVAVIIDTDTANEIDDQFTLAWALLRSDVIDIKAVIAEPFSFEHHREPLVHTDAVRKADRAADDTQSAQSAQSNGGPGFSGNLDQQPFLENYLEWVKRLDQQGTAVEDLHFTTPAEGVDLSVAEIKRVFDAAEVEHSGLVFRGADRYMSGPESAIQSSGVDRIIEIARQADEVLYVVAIGCLTNVASALLLDPDLVSKIVVIWTAGYPSTDERSNQSALNLVQDVHATRVVFESGVPLVYMPGYLIGQQLSLSQPEMHAWVKGSGPLGDLLVELYDNNPLHPLMGIGDHYVRTWVIWDLICLAWLIDPELVPTTIRPTPELGDDLRWNVSESGTRHVMREAIDVNRDGIFRDLFTRLAQ